MAKRTHCELKKTVQFLSVNIGAEFLSSEELAVFFFTVKEGTPQIR